MKTLLSALFVAALFVLLLVFSACSPCGSEASPGQLAFYPTSPEAWEAFSAAADRIETASGVRVYAAIEGTPILFVDRPEDTSDCAQTRLTWNTETREIVSLKIEVYPSTSGCAWGADKTLTHEIIHAIRTRAGLDLEGDTMGHSEHGLFMATTQDDRFEETTLAALCEATDCTIYNPEK